MNGAIVCGSVTSLSPFALFAPTAPTYDICLLYDPDKPVRSGSTVPIRVRLCDASGANLWSPDIALQGGRRPRLGQRPGPLGDSGNANPDGNFRYDGDLAGYVYNLSTKGLTTGSYILRFTVGSQLTLYTAGFQVK